MSRRLTAALACRLNGTRLYGKPLQNLMPGTTILDQIVAAIRTFASFDSIVLGISTGRENAVLEDVAARLGCEAVVGDPDDVLARLIACGRAVHATDVFRVTTESPFFDYSKFDEAWERHVADGNDITVLDYVPEGAAFEIYTLDALVRSHSEGLPADRSEFCSNYARYNQSRFRVGITEPAPECRRPDLRLTVDHPEDLILCRAVYKGLAATAPRVALEDIVSLLDRRPDLVELVRPFVVPEPIWAGVPQRSPSTAVTDPL